MFLKTLFKYYYLVVKFLSRFRSPEDVSAPCNFLMRKRLEVVIVNSEVVHFKHHLEVINDANFEKFLQLFKALIIIYSSISDVNFVDLNWRFLIATHKFVEP